MRFACFGYLDRARWEALSDQERAAFGEQCAAYDAELRRAGLLVGGVALHGPPHAVTLRRRDRELSVTDGPFAETREQLAGVVFLEARDLNHAIQIFSAHPGLRQTTVEIRAVDEAHSFGAEPPS